MNELTRKSWTWKALLIVWSFLAAAFLVDLKYWLALVAVLWVLAALVVLHRLRRRRA